jgi:hypothetical protein
VGEIDLACDRTQLMCSCEHRTEAGSDLRIRWTSLEPP